MTLFRSGRPRRRRLRRQPPILMYHRLTDRTGDHPNSLAAGRFERQLALLRALGYRSVSPTAIAGCLAHGTPLPRRVVAITLDDGYLDALTVGAPLLQRFGFTATCYVVAGALGGHSTWTAPAPLMGWGELRAWLAAGMEVGSHSVRHSDLTTLAEPALHDEVAGSKARLEDGLGIPMRSFAYPFNRLDRRVLGAVAQAGYEAACAGVEVWRSVHALTRVDGAREAWVRFALQLLPTYPALRAAYRMAVPRAAGDGPRLEPVA